MSDEKPFVSAKIPATWTEKDISDKELVLIRLPKEVSVAWLNGLSLDFQAPQLAEFEISTLKGKYSINTCTDVKPAMQLLVQNGDSLAVSTKEFSHYFSVNLDVKVPTIDYANLEKRKKQAVESPPYSQPENLKECCFPFGRTGVSKRKLKEPEEARPEQKQKVKKSKK